MRGSAYAVTFRAAQRCSRSAVICHTRPPFDLEVPFELGCGPCRVLANPLRVGADCAIGPGSPAVDDGGSKLFGKLALPPATPGGRQSRRAAEVGAESVQVGACGTS
mmetsp:Transcript_90079/g.173356  ORF Transcript_90079/g.173356 Transcript_90079/m.173356 type:complete len:107 (+) Transcript_90079:314-634(+)